MSVVSILYCGLILISVIVFSYALWRYHECPSERSHRPYVFPIFTSFGWFVLGMHGFLAQFRGIHLQAPNHYSFLLLIIGTLVALLILIHAHQKRRTS